MKRTFALLCTITLCATLMTPAFAAANTSNTVDAVLNVNTDLMKQAFNKPTPYNSAGSQQIGIVLNTEAATAEITGDIDTTLAGSVNEIICNDGNVGYIGVYDGWLPDGTPVIADVIYNADDVFATVTLGTLGADNFSVTFYGELTDSLKAISNKYTQETEEYHQFISDGDDKGELTPVPYVQGKTDYQGSDDAYIGKSSKYHIGNMSFYLAEELKNQGTMEVITKVNTDCDGVNDYLVDEMGFNDTTLIVYPDTFDITIHGNHDDLHNITDSYLPKEGSTSATVTIPIYGGKYVGLQLLSFTFKMSSTDVSFSRHTSDSSYPNNEINWEIYRKNGWNPWDTDGDESTETGIIVNAAYTYGGNLSSSRYTSMTSTASIRYEYQYNLSGTGVPLHVWTDEMSVSSNINILP